jgi:hypothetical protein
MVTTAHLSCIGNGYRFPGEELLFYWTLVLLLLTLIFWKIKNLCHFNFRTVYWDADPYQSLADHVSQSSANGGGLPRCALKTHVWIETRAIVVPVWCLSGLYRFCTLKLSIRVSARLWSGGTFPGADGAHGH